MYSLLCANIEVNLSRGRVMTTKTLKTANSEARFNVIGATLTHFMIATKSGILDLVLGADPLDFQNLISSNPHVGIIGPIANRIANASFELNNIKYTLPKNNGNNCLHGGPSGYDKREWTVSEQGTDHIVFTLDSTHMTGMNITL